MNSAMIRTFPLLSQEGWREAPGWFQSDFLRECGFGASPRVNFLHPFNLLTPSLSACSA